MNFCRDILNNISAALLFSSRLPLPCNPATDIKAAFAWLPLAGSILSLLALLPFLVGLSGTHWLAAWLYLTVYIWLSRALHWDGLADVMDGLGSNKTGAAFWQVVKDSRLGSMGGLGIFLAGTGYLFTIDHLLAAGRWEAMPWAAALARALALLLPAICPLNPNAGLGKITQEASLSRKMLTWLFLLVVLGSIRFSIIGVCLTAGLSFLVICLLAANAAKQGGFNGDFIGAGIVLSELTAMLSLTLYCL